MKKYLPLTLAVLLANPGHTRTYEQADSSLDRVELLLSMTIELTDLNAHVDSLTERTKRADDIRRLKDQLRDVRRSVRGGAALPSEVMIHNWKQDFFRTRHLVCKQVGSELEKKRHLRAPYLSSERKERMAKLMERYHDKCAVEGLSLERMPLLASSARLGDNMRHMIRLAQKINRNF
ncbi:MAG: hypothetical protein ACK5TR_06490 [Alphaproteobacteria bacterium]|jgi:hypothetical protein|nr:hypothetical protein [Alphaproteobacteria bacterium]